MKIKIDGRVYQLWSEDDKLTLGEQALLKREYGYLPARDEFDHTDPDHVRGYAFMVLRKALPKAPAKALVEQVDGISEVEFVGDDGEPLTDSDVEEPETDPTSSQPGSEPGSESEPDESGQ